MNYVYLLISGVNDRVLYIGYTNDQARRIRQHNGELVGGAKKTTKHRPWKFLAIMGGFDGHCQALRFEARLQHASKKRRTNPLKYINLLIDNLVAKGEGKKHHSAPWPPLTIVWYDQPGMAVSLMANHYYSLAPQLVLELD